ncbi:MAG: hypothetical protein WC683_15155 [bacterium]
MGYSIRRTLEMTDRHDAILQRMIDCQIASDKSSAIRFLIDRQGEMMKIPYVPMIPVEVKEEN